ncbi:MAG: hypothetical protein WKH64_14625 [Chloroflexia bacterium]
MNAQQLVDSVGQALLNRPVRRRRAALIAYVGGGGLLLEDWVLEIKLVHVVALILDRRRSRCIELNQAIEMIGGEYDDDDSHEAVFPN